MAKPETAFRNSVEKHLPPTVHHEKNANPYSGGTADSWYDGPDGDMWIEYKFITLPKRDTTIINLPQLFSTLQLEWLRARYTNGRTIAAIVGCKEGGVLFCNCKWEQACTTQHFKTMLQTRKQLAEWITNCVT